MTAVNSIIRPSYKALLQPGLEDSVPFVYIISDEDMLFDLYGAQLSSEGSRVLSQTNKQRVQESSVHAPVR